MFPHQIQYKFLFFSICATRPACLILDWVTQRMKPPTNTPKPTLFYEVQEHYFIRQLTSLLHSGHFAWPQAAYWLQLIHSPLSRGPRVLVQCTAVNIRFLLPFSTNRKKAKWIGHIVRRNCLLKRVTGGKTGGRSEVTGTRRRRRKQLIDYLTETRRY